MKTETLYKKDSTGKWRVWDGETVDGGFNVYHGTEGGAIQTRFTAIAQGKNIGRANETSPEQQADLELRSKFSKQLDKGYDTKKKDGVRISPMLAHRYDKQSAKIAYPAFVQPKLDGTRCLVYMRDGAMCAFSRNGKPIATVPHITKELGSINSQVIWDGELYIHGENFQELISGIKRSESNDVSERLEMHCYDAFNITDKFDTPFQDRMKYLKQLNGDWAKPVKTEAVSSEEDMWKFHSQFLADGYEGTILRNVNGVYQFGKRSYDLQKVKDFDDAEFEIVGGELDKDGCCVFHCRTESGNTFNVRPEGTVEIRKGYFKQLSSLKGKMLSVRYFGMTTSDNPVPRFPVGVIVRDYE